LYSGYNLLRFKQGVGSDFWNIFKTFLNFLNNFYEKLNIFMINFIWFFFKKITHPLNLYKSKLISHLLGDPQNDALRLTHNLIEKKTFSDISWSKIF
jgi:hypothetical protein